MAIRVDATSDRLIRTASLLSYDADYTVSFWMYLQAEPSSGNNGSLFSLNRNNATGDSHDHWRITESSTNSFLDIRVQTGGSGSTTVTGTTNILGSGWNHIGFIRAGNADRKAYLNGVLEVSNTASHSARSVPTRQEMGGIGSANAQALSQFSARIACIKIWQAALTLTELELEMQTVRPSRFANLHIWTPSIPFISPSVATERVADYSGNGFDWTEGGTLSDEDSPPVSWGSRVIMPQQGTVVAPTLTYPNLERAFRGVHRGLVKAA
jgi:hypothetical protein